MPLRVVLFRPWHLTAVLLVAVALLLTQARPVEAAVGVTVTANNTTASAASDLSIDVVFDAVPINAPATIVVTFPVGWTVPTSADLTAVGVSWAGLQDVTPTITSNAGARTISTTIAVNQMLNGPAPAITLTIPNTSGLTNPGVAGSYSITVDAPGSAQGSGSVNITAGGGTVTGGAVTLTSSTVGANTAGTIAFTLGGVLATSDSIVLTFPAGWTVTNGAMTAGNWTGLDGAPASVTGNAAARTVTIVIGATPQTTLAETITITGSSQLVNPTTPAVGVSIGIAATGQTAGTSNVFNVTAGAPSAYTLTGPAAVNAGAASTNFTIAIQDAFGNTTNTTQNTTFTLASTAAGTVTFNPVSPVTVTTGTSSVTFTYTATQAGSKTITATRASGDAVGGPQTANITVNAGAASNADLSALVLTPVTLPATSTPVTLTPTFAAATTAYSANVGNNVTGADVTATKADSGASITINGTAAPAGTRSNIVLGVGTNMVTIVVTAADTSTKTYTVTIDRDAPPTSTPTVEPDPGTPRPSPTPVACGQNQVSDGSGGCVCVSGYTMVGINCVPAAPRLTALTLMPTQGVYVPITVPVVDGQTVYEVEVVAYEPATKGPRYNLAATMSDPAAAVKVSAFGLEWAPASIAFQSGESATFSATGSSGTSPAYTVRLRAAQARPKLTALALAPLTASGTIDATVPFSDYPRADLTGGQTTFTLTVTTGRSYRVAAEADSGDITYRRSGISFDPTSTRLAAGDTVTIQAANSAGTSSTYTLTLSSPVAALTNAAVTLSSAAANATGVTTTITFNSPVAIPAGGKIKVTLTGFTWPATPNASCSGAPSGVSTSFASNVLTITPLSALLAGTLTCTVTGATLPAAQTARTDVAMSVTTSADVELARTTSGTLVAITAPPSLVVSLSVPSTVSAGATMTATTTVTGAAGRSLTYAWTATPSTTCEAPSTSAAQATFTVTGSGSCTIGVTVTAGTDSASASAVVTIAGQPRLEFVSQPTDSTTGTADINLSVRAVKADGTVDTNFNNQVQLTIQGGGSSFGLGSVTAVGGVATFTRTYNPSRADATWTLRATQISGRAAGVYAPATSDSFRVTKPPTLRFSTQPVGGTAGAALTTQPKVTAYNADGTVNTTFTGTVTLTLKADTANGATLTSTATAGVVGVATFAGANVNNAGAGYVLVASATGYAEVASEPFNVTGAATKIVLTQYPSAFVVGRDNTIEVRAEARDAADRVVTGAANQLGLLLNNDTARETSRMATSPTRVEDGVAVFTVSHRFTSAGQYRWGVDQILTGQSSALPQANTEAFTVAKPASKLAFVQQPEGFGSVLSTQPIVEVQDEDGNRIPRATNDVMLIFRAANDTDPIMTGGARRAATAGRITYTGVGFTGGTARSGARFTITAVAAGLTSAVSASFGPAGPTTKLAFTSDLPCGLVARPGCSPAAKAGQQFTITVAAQDASGQVNPSENGSVTLTGDGNSGMAARTASFVDGVATFTGVAFISPSATGYTLTATLGALTVSSGKIVVTPDNTPASLRLTAVPTHEVNGVAFTTQPVVEVYNAAGQRITGATGSVVLSLHKQDGTTTSALSGTTSVVLASGVAQFTGLRVTGADTGLYLKATLGTLEANQTGTFRVYADAASATVARSSEQSQSKSFSLKLNIDTASARPVASQSLKTDICIALSLAATDCARIQVTASTALTAAIVATDESGQVLAIMPMAGQADEETVRIGPVNLRSFQAETGATAPAGTTVLYAVGRIATDAFGNRLDVLNKPGRFSLAVPESVVLPGVLPGDLKVAWWDGRRWIVVPSATATDPDGSFTVTANTDALGVFAVLYAPGAGRVQGFGGFSAFSGNEDAAVGLGIFAGGSTTALAHAVGLSGADGVWVQDAGGEFRLLLANGPAFVSADFHRVFANGLAPNTVVLLVRAPTS